MSTNENTLTQKLLNHLFEYKEGNLYWKSPTSIRVRIGQIAGGLDANGYSTIGILGNRYKTHRIIYFMFYNKFPIVIDHINGIPSDNRIENLREATQQNNVHNARTPKDNKSGIKGVCWDKSRNKWLCTINVNYKQIHIGRFEKINEAKQAIEKARNLHHGIFCNHG